MKAITPYLNFDGQTREAMTFYHQALGGELSIQSFADVGAGTGEAGERIMHANIRRGSAVLMASDTQPGMKFVHGNNCHITIDCDSVEEIEKLFTAFSEGGKVVMPLQDTFWGARFGMLSDRFGVQWMFNCELPKVS